MTLVIAITTVIMCAPKNSRLAEHAPGFDRALGERDTSTETRRCLAKGGVGKLMHLRIYIYIYIERERDREREREIDIQIHR